VPCARLSCPSCQLLIEFGQKNVLLNIYMFSVKAVLTKFVLPLLKATMAQ